MLIPSRRSQEHASSGWATPRRGIALVFVLVFVIAMAALAMSSIFMASNANLLAKSYDKERDLRFASEAALAIGKSRVNADPSILVMPPDSVEMAILSNQSIVGADNKAIPGIKVNVYVGPTGSMSGQDGRFSSIVAEARDQRGNGFIRRLELTQESFAKFAYWSNDESPGGSIIYFNNGDELWGPIWSNDVIHIGSGGAIFHDQVATSQTISGANYGTFIKGKLEKQKPIALPSTTQLSKLQPIAASSGWSFAGQGNANNYETQLRDRIEFLAIDLNKQNDSTDANEGFFRYYEVKSGYDSRLRGDWPSSATLSTVDMCGDFHYAPTSIGGGQQFYPASVHSQTWFRDQIKQGYMDNLGWTSAAALTAANAEQVNTLGGILGNSGARCYLAGDPHLVATDRSTGITDPNTGAKYPTTAVQRGGTDTTFTPVGLYGAWRQYVAVANDSIAKYRPWDGRYLYPIDRGFNTNAKGVIYIDKNVGLSGTLNGRLTLYAKGSVVLLDDLRYANDPVKGVCHDILGLITDKDVVVADNAINTPPLIKVSKNSKYFTLDDTKDFYFHGVIMALGSSFRVEDYDQGPTDANDCASVNNGRGCIYLAGGIIQQARGPVGTSAGTGYSKRYSYDHCAVVTPPPYFPTTGRFQDNRYVELDPAGFKARPYFESLAPKSP